MKLSIVVPCYNESKNLKLILNRFKEVIKRDDVEVVLVNNGSTDDTETILKEILSGYTFVRLIKVEVNQGYGFGILSGLKSAHGTYIGWTHADMQTDPYDSVKALEIIESKGEPNNIFVKGSRTGRSVFDNFFTIGMSIFESLYLKKKLWEINAQPNVFHRSFFEGWENPPSDFSLDLYALYMAKVKENNIVRFKVKFPKRIYGKSSWNTGLKAKWKFIKRTIEFSKKLRKELQL